MTHDTAPGGSRESELTALLTDDAPDPTDHERVRKYLHALAALGCAPLLVYPRSKVAADMRTPQKCNAEDKAAQHEARDAGRKGWQRVKSPAGVYLATKDTAVLDGYLDHYAKTFDENDAVNVAVSVGRSRLVIVDCDTEKQVTAFLLAANLSSDTPPTVRTPGAKNADGTWIHSDGGHFWFTLPEGVELPAGSGSFTDPDGGYAVMWGAGSYVLTVPSVRAEGRYVAAGDVHVLPDWLRDRIVERAPAAPRVTDRAVASDIAAPISEWSRAVLWAEILGPLGWIPTGRPDSCGCETWTASGEHSSPKSATAHEPGCAEPRYDTDNPPMHIWTDNPGAPFDAYVQEAGKQTLSKLQAVAWIDFEGDEGAAMEALGLMPEPVTLGARQGDRTNTAGSENLPGSFWASWPALSHIRQAAHSRINSADAVLGAALVRLAAHLDPCVTVDTGVKEAMPLSMFVGLVGSAGTGKSSAYAAAGRLLAFTSPDPMIAGLVAGCEMPLELPVGSGPGLAEAFMGTVADPQNPKGRGRREQVNHKLLLHSDEGAGLVAGILDAKRGQDIGPALRTAWTGAVLGQANASAERRREVRDYVVGLCVGFQLEALAALSTPEQLEYGTPQRFLYVSATDPAIPNEVPDDPGSLPVSLPSEPLRYSDELRARARREALVRTRGFSGDASGDNPMDAHRPAMLARLAALLVVLCDPGRTVIETTDVELAEVLLDSSARLHGVAVRYRRERESAESERRSAARISEQVTAAVAVDHRDAAVGKLETRIEGYLDKAGGAAAWSGRDGLRQKFKSEERPLAEVALDQLLHAGTLTRHGDQLSRP